MARRPVTVARARVPVEKDEITAALARLFHCFGDENVRAALAPKNGPGRPRKLTVSDDLHWWVAHFATRFTIERLRAAAVSKKARGRPRQIRASAVGLMLSIDEIANTLHEQGISDPLEAAFKEFLDLEKMETLE